MAWVKVPAEHHPLFLAALPSDPGVETKRMFGGVVAQLNGHNFAALFGRSVAVTLPEPARREALALDGASYFDPMGDGRRRSDKIMRPDAIMHQPSELRAWIARAFDAVRTLPPKERGPKRRKAG